MLSVCTHKRFFAEIAQRRYMELPHNGLRNDGLLLSTLRRSACLCTLRSSLRRSRRARTRPRNTCSAVTLLTSCVADGLRGRALHLLNSRRCLRILMRASAMIGSSTGAGGAPSFSATLRSCKTFSSIGRPASNIFLETFISDLNCRKDSVVSVCAMINSI